MWSYCMVRKLLKKTTKSFPLLKKRECIYILNLEVNNVFELFDTFEFQASRDILMNFIITTISIFTMAQIAISAKPENLEYLDKLPSYVDIKRKFISSSIGRTFAACLGFARALPYLIHEKKFQNEYVALNSIKIITDMLNSTSSNTKKSKPSVSDWQIYAIGEMIAALGQMLSCPSTNLKFLNINQREVVSYDLRQCIRKLGLNKKLYLKYNITLKDIKDSIQNVYMLDMKSIPMKKLIYTEPIIITSRIQNEILGNSILRNNFFNIKDLEYKDLVSMMCVIQKQKFLTKYELMAYDFAIKVGDKNILKKYTELIRKRLNNK
uniref:Uncharacterized protein n=1 Tax=Cryptoglena skujai TaxID=161229 RepID=A0A0G3SKG8_9EUGL|nr:hypothetical protein [Cryptoglena skujai]AKL39047.1 hypothetical protein [Cryptoglena skujai]